MKKTLQEAILEVLERAPDLIDAYRKTYNDEPDPFVLGVMIGTSICLDTFDKQEQEDFFESWTNLKFDLKDLTQ